MKHTIGYRIIICILSVIMFCDALPLGVSASETEIVTEIPSTLEKIDMSIENGKIVVNSIPNFYQNYFFYSFVPYGSGTLGSNGCGITCMAMVATYINDDYTLTSDRLAEEFCTYKGTNIDKMEAAADAYGISYEKTFKWSKIIEGLEEGKFAIVLVNENTSFTEKQHFIVLTKMENGKIFVNDPNYRNYKTLSDGFENGFEQWEIISGFQGGWIFEKECESFECLNFYN